MQEPINNGNDEWIFRINNKLIELQQAITTIFQSFKRVGGVEQHGYSRYDHSNNFLGNVEQRGSQRDLRVWDDVFELQSKYGMVRGDAIGQTAEGLYKNTDTQYRLYEGKNTEQYLLNLGSQLERVKESVNASKLTDKYDLRLLTEVIEKTSVLERQVLKYHVKEPSVILQPHIPAQLPAPIKVGVVDNKLQIINTTTMTGEISPASFERLRTSLSDNLRGAIIIVRRSNIDQRFAAILDDMIENLAVSQDNFSPEALGINFELYLSVLNLYIEEIPDVAMKRFESLNRYIPVLLNQFEDWRRFKALILPALKNEELDILLKTASAVRKEFGATDASQVISPTIGERLGMLTLPILRGYINVESIANPLFASLSNVFAGISDAAISYIPESVEGVSTSAVLATIPSLGVVAVGLLKKHANELARVPGLRFILRVLEYITDVLKQGKV